jgi:hypothetical protein
MASRVEHKWNEVMRLNKFKNLLEYMIRAKIIYPSSSTKRYSALMDLVFKNRIKTIMEIGIYTGRRAVEMINTAIIHHRPNDITYLGFDLFEEMNDDILRDQLSKRPDTLSALQAKIERTGAIKGSRRKRCRKWQPENTFTRKLSLYLSTAATRWKPYRRIGRMSERL